MNIKKLDNRFKLYKQGLATYMVDVSSAHFGELERIMTDAYGKGQIIYQREKNVPLRKDWFYSYFFKKTRIRDKSNVTIYGQPTVYDDHLVELLCFRVYFRREEQATFLALKQI